MRERWHEWSTPMLYMGEEEGCNCSYNIQMQHMRLKELVYADDMCLMASSPEQLQALIDALAAYCATLHTELISVPKTKAMVISDAPMAPVLFTRNGNPVEQVATFKYLGLHFHQSGAISRLIKPIKACWMWTVLSQL